MKKLLKYSPLVLIPILLVLLSLLIREERVCNVCSAFNSGFPFQYFYIPTQNVLLNNTLHNCPLMPCQFAYDYFGTIKNFFMNYLFYQVIVIAIFVIFKKFKFILRILNTKIF